MLDLVESTDAVSAAQHLRTMARAGNLRALELLLRITLGRPVDERVRELEYQVRVLTRRVAALEQQISGVAEDQPSPPG